MADEEAFSSMFLLCVWQAASLGGRQSQNQGCAYLHLNVKEIVPYVFEVHILRTEVKQMEKVRYYLILHNNSENVLMDELMCVFARSGSSVADKIK